MSPFRRVLVLVCSFTLVCASSFAQQALSPTISAVAFLQRSLAAQVGNTPPSDVTMTGLVHRIAGSEDETGTVILRSLSSGSMRLDFVLPSGPRSEVRTLSSGIPTGTWAGTDGVFHQIASHNVANDWSWFPAFAVANSSNQPTSVVTLVGTETHNDQLVVHLTAYQQSTLQPGDVAALMQHLSQIELFLDSSTLLPESIVYNVHPDNNILLDIPVELRFSNYQMVSGIRIPFHVQKFVNNSLSLDLQFQNVTLNSGLSAAQLGAQ
jgi:hypothetical protein